MESVEEKSYYTAKEVQAILGITYSALRNHVHTGRIRSTRPPGKRQAVYLKEDVDQLQESKEEKDYYTAKEARAILGMTYSALRNQVDAGNITSTTPPGRHQAVYNKEEVDRLKAEMKVKEKLAHNQRAKKTGHRFVDWIGVDDVLTSLKLDYRVYGSEVFLADLPYYAERVVRNPHVALAVYDSPKRERILAYISLLPLPEPIIFEVLRGERHATGIRTEEVETYERKGGYTLLAESVVADPDHSEQLNTLLNHLMQYWCEQYPDRYITRIYAQAESRRGDILIQKLFFAPREDLASNAYVLNLSRPGASRFIRHFQQCLEEKRNASGLQEAP